MQHFYFRLKIRPFHASLRSKLAAGGSPLSLSNRIATARSITNSPCLQAPVYDVNIRPVNVHETYKRIRSIPHFYLF